MSAPSARPPFVSHAHLLLLNLLAGAGILGPDRDPGGRVALIHLVARVIAGNLGFDVSPTSGHRRRPDSWCKRVLDGLSAGLILGSHRHRATQVINQAFDAFAWLSQIVLFLMLGLLVTPNALLPILGPSLVIAAVLMLIARPVAVALCLLPFRYTAPEIAFISWVGLRGAVPIFLAIIPVLAGLPDAAIFFGVAFTVVLISLILQGWTVAAVAGCSISTCRCSSRLPVWISIFPAG
jgi:hypothetical protein